MPEILKKKLIIFLFLILLIIPSATAISWNNPLDWLKKSDQRYNDTGLISSVNISLDSRITDMNTSQTSWIESNFLKIIDMFTKLEIIGMISGNKTEIESWTNDAISGNVSSLNNMITNNISGLSSKYLNLSGTNADQNITLGSYSLKVNYLDGIQNWSHVNYPVACPEGSAITQLGDSVICTSYIHYSDEIYINKNSSRGFNFNPISIWASISGNRTQIETNTDNVISGNRSYLESQIGLNYTASINYTNININGNRTYLENQIALNSSDNRNYTNINTNGNVTQLNTNIFGNWTDLEIRKLNITDQRYNDTELINSVNDSLDSRITDMNASQTSWIEATFLKISDMFTRLEISNMVSGNRTEIEADIYNNWTDLELRKVNLSDPILNYTYNLSYDAHVNNFTKHNDSLLYNMTESYYADEIYINKNSSRGFNLNETRLNETAIQACVDSGLNSTYNFTYDAKVSYVYGDCPSGQFVENTTVSGVQCGTPTAVGDGSYNVSYDIHVSNMTLHNDTFLVNHTKITYDLWDSRWYTPNDGITLNALNITTLSGFNNKILLSGENITAGTINFARLPTLTNTHTLNALNITTPTGFNNALTLDALNITTLTGFTNRILLAAENITSGTINFLRLPILSDTHTHKSSNITIDNNINMSGYNITTIGKETWKNNSGAIVWEIYVDENNSYVHHYTG